MDSRFVSPLLMWAIAFSGATLIGAAVPAVPLFEKNQIAGVASALLFMNWAGFQSLGIWQNRQAAKSAAGITNLQTAGVYSLVRHPIYFSDMSMTAAVFFYTPNLNVLLAGAWVCIVLYRWAMLEEEALAKKFGKKYSDYCKRVPRLLPRFI